MLPRFRPLIALCCLLLSAAGAGADATAPPQDIGTGVFARVGNTEISVNTYKQALNSSGRNLFYHGRPPDQELIAFQKKVADQLIDREILRQEADRKAIEIETTSLNSALDAYRQRAHRHQRKIDENSPQWQRLKNWVRDELRIQQLEQMVRASLGEPTETDLRDYYQAHLDKFTEPARWRLSSIVLKVAPSSSAQVWEAARHEARDLVRRLRGGADFAAMARLHSGDASAAKGGDMGYLHSGMLSTEAQAAIEKLAPGDISDPLTILEGIVIFRLDGKKASRTHNFAQARQRIRQFWQTESGDQRWQAYLQELRSQTQVVLNEKYLNPAGVP